MKKIDIQNLEEEYRLISTVTENYCTELVRQISCLISVEQITLAVPIQFRIKKWESIIDKINQGRFVIKKSILELQDIVGLRIILLFKRDHYCPIKI